MGHLKYKRHSTMAAALLIMPLVLDIAIGEVVNTMRITQYVLHPALPTNLR